MVAKANFWIPSALLFSTFYTSAFYRNLQKTSKDKTCLVFGFCGCMLDHVVSKQNMSDSCTVFSFHPIMPWALEWPLQIRRGKWKPNLSFFPKSAFYAINVLSSQIRCSPVGMILLLECTILSGQKTNRAFSPGLYVHVWGGKNQKYATRLCNRSVWQGMLFAPAHTWTQQFLHLVTTHKISLWHKAQPNETS